MGPTGKWPPDWWHHIRSTLWAVGSGLWATVLPRTECRARHEVSPEPRALSSTYTWWHCVIPVAVLAEPHPALRDLRLQRRLRSLVLRAGCLSLLVGMMVVLSGVSIATADLSSSMEDDDAVIVSKHVQGQVSAITPSFINVVYQKDAKKGVEYELPLHIGKNVELRYRRSLDEIQFGDTVSVTYEEKQRRVEQRDRDGSLKVDTQVVAREAKVITFLKPAKQGLVSGDE